MNAGAFVDSVRTSGYHGAASLESFYSSIGIGDPLNFVSSNATASGVLEWVDWERSKFAAEFIREHTDVFAGRGNGDALQRAKNAFLMIAGTVFYDARPAWMNFRQHSFEETLGYAWRQLEFARDHRS